MQKTWLCLYTDGEKPREKGEEGENGIKGGNFKRNVHERMGVDWSTDKIIYTQQETL